MEAIYDTSNNIVEWYFDMTKNNLVDDNGKPFFIDLYLDIVVMPNGKTLLLDEDELENALKNNIITEQEYKLANDTAEIIMRNYITNKNFMIDFFEKYLLAFD